MMSKPMRCDECGEKAVMPTVLEIYSTDLDHDGRKYRVEVHNLSVYRCAACGEVEMDTEAAGRIHDAFRDVVGVLPAGEIRKRRKGLGLKQDDMAALLGVAVSTLSRWETGAQMQQRCMDTMLRAFFEVPELRDFLIRHAGREDLALAVKANTVAPAQSQAPEQARWLDQPSASLPGELVTTPPAASRAIDCSDMWRQMDSVFKGDGWKLKTPSLVASGKLVA